MARMSFDDDSHELPIVSIVVPFWGVPTLWLGSSNIDFGPPKTGTTVETTGHTDEGYLELVMMVMVIPMPMTM